MDKFRIRLNCIDHYQAEPTDFDAKIFDDNEKEQQVVQAKVPIIRVFGATETGQKVCAHVHGAFPYLFVRYDGRLDVKNGEIHLVCVSVIRLMNLQSSHTSISSICQSITPLP